MRPIIFIVIVFILPLVCCTSEAFTGFTPCALDEQTLVIEPLCSFNPKVQTSTPFPVRPLLDELAVSSDEFSFSWSSDAEFGGSAISISYDLLPLEVEITEIATDCTKTAVLEKSYWD